MWERTRRTCWKIGRLLLGGLGSALPFFKDSGDELYLFLLSILLPFLHLACVGTEEVITSHRLHQETIFISLRENDGERFQDCAFAECENSSVAVRPASWNISWAPKTVELALWRRSSRGEASFLIVFCHWRAQKDDGLLHEVLYSFKGRRCMVAECADRVVNASSHYEHFAISASGTWSTAVNVGGFNISGESSCSSQGLGKVYRILWVVGKFLGENSLLQGFSTVGGGRRFLVAVRAGIDPRSCSWHVGSP